MLKNGIIAQSAPALSAWRELIRFSPVFQLRPYIDVLILKSESSAKKNKNKGWQYVTTSAVIIGIMSSLAGIFNVVKNNFQPAPPESTQLTIYVHGPQGPQDYLLEYEGELLLDLNGDRRSARIGEKGRTVFTEIPAKFKGQALPIAVRADGYEAEHPEKLYEWSHQAIYFPVRVELARRQIKGIVSNEDGSVLLADVTVIIDSEFVTRTDSIGRFSFVMDEASAMEKYNISFQKAGYQSLSEYYYPQSSQEFRLKQK